MLQLSWELPAKMVAAESAWPVVELSPEDLKKGQALPKRGLLIIRAGSSDTRVCETIRVSARPVSTRQ